MTLRGLVLGDPFVTGSARLCMGRSAISNIGVYAVDAIKKGQVVIMLPRPTDPAHITRNGSAIREDMENVLLDESGERWHYPRGKDVNLQNVGFFINWNYLEPDIIPYNCVWTPVKGNAGTVYTHLKISSVRSIKPGEQLLLDYGTDYMDQKSIDQFVELSTAMHTAMKTNFEATMHCLASIRQQADQLYI